MKEKGETEKNGANKTPAIIFFGLFLLVQNAPFDAQARQMSANEQNHHTVEISGRGVISPSHPLAAAAKTAQSLMAGAVDGVEVTKHRCRCQVKWSCLSEPGRDGKVRFDRHFEDGIEKKAKLACFVFGQTALHESKQCPGENVSQAYTLSDLSFECKRNEEPAVTAKGDISEWLTQWAAIQTQRNAEAAKEREVGNQQRQEAQRDLTRTWRCRGTCTHTKTIDIFGAPAETTRETTRVTSSGAGRNNAEFYLNRECSSQGHNFVETIYVTFGNFQLTGTSCY